MIIYSVFVGCILNQKERCCKRTCLSELGWDSWGWTTVGRRGLEGSQECWRVVSLSFSGHWIFRGWLSVNLGLGCIVKYSMVIPGLIKELFVSSMHRHIVLGKLHIKVGYPSKFSVYISLLADFRIVWHSCAFYLIQLIWIWHFLWLLCYDLIHSIALVEILLKWLSNQKLPYRNYDFSYWRGRVKRDGADPMLIRIVTSHYLIESLIYCLDSLFHLCYLLFNALVIFWRGSCLLKEPLVALDHHQ